MKTAVRTFLAAGLFAGALSANAAVTFDLAAAPTSSVSVTDFDGGLICNLTGCGISTTLNANLGNLSSTLTAGQSWEFDFFTLSFSGLGGGTGTIAASLGFDSPLGAPTASGTATGGFVTFFGTLTGGSLTWSNPSTTYSLPGGTSYSVEFENLSGLTVGTATVNGRVTLLQESTTVRVPEPASLALLGLGLLGLGLIRKRKSRV